MIKTGPSRSAAHQRGAAMLIVLIAVALATILALSFLASQGPTAVVASNIDRKAKARAIAESALQMAIDYVNEDADWRDDKTSGVWMTDAALDGGTFTLYGTDEADGDLSDNNTDELLLSVIATYNGVSHRVSVRTTPGASSAGYLLFIAGDSISPSADDQAKIDLFTSWGYMVSLLDDSDDQVAYDNAIAINDVVYISEEVSGTEVGSKLYSATIGVVNEEESLQDNFGMTAASADDSDNTAMIQITNNTHAITQTLPAGEVAIVINAMNLHYNRSTLATGVTTLAKRDGIDSSPTILIADSGVNLHTGTAAGRRVMLPFGNSFNINNLTENGKKIVKRSLSWAAGKLDGTGPSPIALYAFHEVAVDAPQRVGHWRLDDYASRGVLFFEESLTMSNGSLVDAFDSSIGAYGGLNQQEEANVKTNITSDGGVYLQNANIYGDVQVGAGSSPASVIDIDTGSISGTQTAQDENINLPTNASPEGFGPHSGNQIYDGGTHTINSNQHFNKLTIINGATLYISGNVQIKLSSNAFEMDNGHIVLNPGASLTLWCGHNVMISNGSTINNDTSRPGDCTLIQYSQSRDIVIEDSRFVGALFGSYDFILRNGAEVFGNVYIAKSVVMDNAAIHVDMGSDPPGGGIVLAAEDEASAANDGIGQYPTAQTAGLLGTAFSFDGVSDYLLIPHHPSYLLDAGSVGLHFYPESLGGQQGLFSKDSSGLDNGGHLTIYTDGTRLKALIQTDLSDPYNTGTSIVLESASGALADDIWHHAVVTWGDGQFRLYLNGALVDSANHLGGLGTTSGGSGNEEPIVIGAMSDHSSNLSATPADSNFAGRIDDVRIYDLPLDAIQVASLAAGSEPGDRAAPGYVVADTSGFSEPADLLIYDTSKIAWIDTGGLQFTGETISTTLGRASKIYDRIESSGEFTIELIIERANPAFTGSPSLVLGYTSGMGAYNFLVGQNGSKYQARVRDSSTGTTGVLTPELTSTSDLNSVGDTHVVLTYDQGDVRVYVDGSLDETRSTGGTLDNWDAAMLLVLGGAYDGSDYWQGTVKRLVIYDEAFNGNQARNVYNGEAPGDGSGGPGTAVWDEVD